MKGLTDLTVLLYIFFGFIVSRYLLHGTLWFERECSEFCRKQSFVTEEQCCGCFTQPVWMSTYRNQVLTTRMDNSSSSLIVEYPQNVNESSFLAVIHRNGMMKDFPSSLCNFSNIVHVDFSYNLISVVNNVFCLVYLDVLTISHNRIRYIGRNTFINNTYLRVLDLSFNSLLYIEPGTFSTLSILEIKLQHNILSSYDASDFLFSEKPLCYINASYNNLGELTNRHNLMVNSYASYGPGFVDLRSNKFRNIFNFSMFGITDPVQMGKFIYWGFDIRHNPWFCDCSFAPYALLFHTVLESFKRDYFHIECQGPSTLRGKTLTDIISENSVYLLTCELTRQDGCPENCHCYFQPVAIGSRDPETNFTVVNCRRAGLRSIPFKVPIGSNLRIDLSFNNISKLEYRYYFPRIRMLDLSMNDLEILGEEGVSNLMNASKINLSENKNLKNIPKSLFQLHPCQFLISEMTLECSCQHISIKKWLNSYATKSNCSIFTNIYCTVILRKYLIMNVSDSEFHCEQGNAEIFPYIALLTSVVVLFIIMGLFIHIFRFEAKVIYRRYFPCYIKTRQKLQYELYISFDENDDFLRKWVLSDFVPRIENENFRVFVPVRDLVFGSVRNEEILKAVSSSCNFLCIFSEKYFSEESSLTRLEWRYIWNCSMLKQHRRLVVLNHALLGIDDVQDRKARAFMRFGCVLNFQIQNQKCIPILRHI